MHVAGGSERHTADTCHIAKLTNQDPWLKVDLRQTHMVWGV